MEYLALLGDTILPEQEEFLARFLDSGGGLMMVSADYLYDSGLTPFAQEYLHVTDYVDVPMEAWDGIEGDPITHGMSFVGECGLGSKMPCGRISMPADSGRRILRLPVVACA